MENESPLHEVHVQRVDGKMVVKLPPFVSAQDFEDWLNDKPNKKPLRFVEVK